MSLEPVSAAQATGAPRPSGAGHHAKSGHPSSLPLRLTLGSSAPGGERWAHGEHGQVYRFAVGEGLPGWREGQTILVEVLRAGPPLEVKLLGVLTPDGGVYATGPEADTPAVRPDQAAILRLAAASSDSMAQAAHWRQRSLHALWQAATLNPEPSIPNAAEVGSRPPPTNEISLLLRPLPWHGWALTLWIEQRRSTPGLPNRRARRRSSARLGLCVALPPVGTIGLLIDVLEVEVGLTITTPDASAVALLRDQVSAIAARMGRAGLRLMRCHVRHEPHWQAPVHAAESPALASHELPLALFRAGAESLEALRGGLGRGRK